jgi:ABC-2 type transport system permease protein
VVAQILRLKLLLLANSFRRTPLQVVGVVFGLAYGVGSAVFLAAGLFALRFYDVEIARSAVVVFGALALIVFAVLPLVLGIEDILDPRRFALFGMSNAVLSASIAIASLISVPAIVIGIIAFAQVTTWTRGALPFGLSIVAAVVIILTCLLSARISTTLATFLFSTRRARDLTALSGLALLVLLAPLLAYLASVDWAANGMAVLGNIADVVGWTPLGAAWAAPADAAAGSVDTAWEKLAIAVVWLVVLASAWRLLVGAVLVRPQRQAQAKQYVGLGWFDRLPGTPAGAIAARSLTYWTRDARYVTSLAVIPLVPIIMVVALVVAGVPLSALALLPVPVMCLFLSWSVHNDVSFDNTAIWLHLVSSTRGISDRWGRLVPVLVLGVPLVLLGSVLSAWAYGDWTVLPSLIGVSSSILLIGLGLSSILSAQFPYPAVRPGDSPFSQPQTGGNAAGLIQGLSFFGIVLLSAPAFALAILGFVFGGIWPVLSLVVGVVVGLAALVLGVRAGSAVFDRRGPELLAEALRN